MWGWVATGFGVVAYGSLCYYLQRRDEAIRKAREEERRKCTLRDLEIKRKLKRLLQSLRQERQEELAALRRYKDKMQQKNEKTDWPREGF